MKFRVTKQVCCFGVGTQVYYPDDVVEGPPEWAKINPFLEPIPEPMLEPIILSEPVEEPIIAAALAEPAKRKKKDDAKEPDAATDRSAEQR